MFLFLDDSPSQVTVRQDKVLPESPHVPMDLISGQPKVSGRAGKPGQNSPADSKRDVHGMGHPPSALALS